MPTLAMPTAPSDAVLYVAGAENMPDKEFSITVGAEPIYVVRRTGNTLLCSRGGVRLAHEVGADVVTQSTSGPVTSPTVTPPTESPYPDPPAGDGLFKLVFARINGVESYHWLPDGFA